tara:strand:+ start:719 stop:1081 length:363 start_codon:yes stop_codon:yes gene_type:complete
MSIYTNLELAKFQVEHNRIIWDRLNIGIRQIILYSDNLFPSVKNETNYKGINFDKLKTPILKRYVREGGDEKGNPFTPNIFDDLVGGFSEEDIIELAKPSYPDKEICGQNFCPTCTPNNL